MKKQIAVLCNSMRFALIGTMTIAILASVATGWMKGDGRAGAHPEPTLKIDNQPLKREGSMTVSFAPVIQKVAPSVVKVFTSTEAKPNASRRGPGLEQFFGEKFRGFEFPDMQGSKPKSGLGSGVIVSPEGYILTNNHVIEGANTVKVVLSPGNEEYAAAVVGVDPKSDVAVLKIDALDLQPIELGNSDQILVGDLVLAIGNPFGVGQTVTMGMVSAKGRSNMGLDYEDFIQTDAAINPGNSGGALVDAEGRLIGVNTAILSQSGGNLGIGFAIPVNLARSVMESLINHGHVVRGYLGVNIQDVQPAMASHFGMEGSTGALIADVVPGSPADAAGLQAGDVVVEFGGKKIKDSRHLKLVVGQSAPNQGYGLEINRGGELTAIEVSLDELSDKGSQWASQSGRNAESYWPGDMQLEELTPELRRQFQIPSRIKGIL
ncbi:MAG TPA: peptidase S1, partial [Verrucomicrobiales bacterium]|nr:peptidase S1 [Verrucomicrobiales bacterium]